MDTVIARTQSGAGSPRYHDLDAVRALALLLGVVLHGAMSFMEPRIWIVADAVTSTGGNIAFYVIHMFRMTTFFVLAGFFARLLLQKRTLSAFIGNRLKRVGIPLIAFWPVTTFAIVAIMIIANMPPPGTPATPPPPPPAFTAQTFPLTHLWFLYVLLLLYAGTAMLKVVTDTVRIGGFLGAGLDRIVGILTKSDLITVLLALPVAATFYANKGWMIWFGIQTPDTGLFPNMMAVAGFVTAYGFGWWLHRRADLLDHLASRFWIYGLTAVAGTWWCLNTLGNVPALIPTPGSDHPLYCLIYPLSTWSWTFFLIGAGRALIKKENAMLRFVSDASYWVYIVHLPLVLLFQYLVKDLNWLVEYKFAAVIFGAMAVALLSYRFMVRYSFVGTILNGRRRKSKSASTTQEAIA